MFTLIVEVGKALLADPTKVLDSKALGSKLAALESKIIKAKTENPETNRFAKYYKHMFQQTTSRTGRAARGLVVSEIL